ncbi:YgjV family protein [Shewanella sp.]|uniref:YgjV family protein n=1 Tax=Shewanella sp. TaxID=50422 RepID=UPI000EEBA832|nr:YgjV family protein [Shewanella sp.]HCD15223.1 hypothetical protein [Shewanella sp.]
MSIFVISQLLVTLALLSDLLSFQFRHRRAVLACLLVSGLLISAHFILLNHWSPAILMLVASVRFFVSIFTVDRRLMWLFMAASVTAVALSFNQWLDLLSLAGSLLQTRAAFCRDDKRLRELMFIGSGCWLLNNILLGSTMAVLMESVFIGSNLLGYYRFYLRRKGSAPAQGG